MSSDQGSPRTWSNQGAALPPVASVKVGFAHVYGEDGPKAATLLLHDTPWLDMLSPEPDTTGQTNPEPNDDMTTQDLHIETRLAGIEKNLDSRMDAMQRYQEAADQRARESEARAERLSRDAEERQEKSILRIENTVAEMRKESRGIKRAVRTAAWGAALTAVLGFAGVAALIQNTVNEQGAWVRQNIDRADQDRSELTDTLKSIQATQQSILDRLPPEQTTSPQQ